MKLAADANVLLSALIGGRARLVVGHPDVEGLFTVASVMEEVREYLPELARQRRLSEDTLMLALAALPVVVADPAQYARQLPEARRRIENRDPDDVDLLALALAMKVPVWSNDDDFRTAGVERYTTAQLLKKLGTRD